MTPSDQWGPEAPNRWCLSTATSLTAAEANLMSTEYKRKAVEQLDTFDLIDAIITRPTLSKALLKGPFGGRDCQPVALPAPQRV